jgi:hypothetical protein
VELSSVVLVDDDEVEGSTVLDDVESWVVPLSSPPEGGPPKHPTRTTDATANPRTELSLAQTCAAQCATLAVR